jgi:imidazolonepropionase-like amidohydrolase
MNMLVLNFFGDTVDTRSPLRFSLPAQKASTIDLDGKEMQAFIALLKEKKIAVDPTMGVFENLFTSRDGVMDERFNTIVQRFPVLMQRNIRAGGGGVPVPEGMDATYRQAYHVFGQLLFKLYNNNIPIVAGTDGMAGFDLHRELELYVKAGIPADKVLQIATINTARYVKKDRDLGSITIGKMADILLVEGDPVLNISNIRKTRFVISGSSVFDAGRLYEAITIKPR